MGTYVQWDLRFNGSESCCYGSRYKNFQVTSVCGKVYKKLQALAHGYEVRKVLLIHFAKQVKPSTSSRSLDDGDQSKVWNAYDKREQSAKQRVQWMK